MKLSPRVKRIGWLVLSGLAGLAIGGYLFSDVQPRSFLAVTRCQESCWQANDLAGLFASIGMTKAIGLIPSVVLETDKSIVIDFPFKTAPTHYVIVPKKDIRDVSQLTDADKPSVEDVQAVIGQLIREHHLRNYEVTTYGPEIQHVTWVHWHLIDYGTP